MDTPDFFRSRIDSMIDLRSPLAVLATRIPWAQIGVVLTPKFEHEDRAGQVVQARTCSVRRWPWSGLDAATPAGPSPDAHSPHGQPAVLEAQLQPQR